MAGNKALSVTKKIRKMNQAQPSSWTEAAFREMDRTEREQTRELAAANEAVEAERERLICVLDQLPGFACLIKPDYTIHFANRKFRKLFGEAEDRPCFASIRRLVKPCGDCSLRHVAQAKKEVRFELQIPSGEVYQVYQYALNELDGSLRILELGLDITERSKTKAALELERHKLRRIMDAMPYGVYIVNRDKNIIYTNPALVKEFGPVKGRKCHEYFEGSRRPCPGCTIPQVMAGRSLNTEWHSKRNNRTYDLFATPIRDENGSIAKLAIRYDITERKRMWNRISRSEDRFRTLVETMSEGLVVIDVRRRINYVNARMCEMLAYTAAELVGRRPEDFLDAGSRREFKSQFDIHQKGLHQPYELVWIRRDGKRVLTFVSPKPIRDPNGRIEGNFAVITDITEYRRSQEELQESERQLRSLSMQLLRAQETERGRISRELHDELGQELSILKLRIGLVRKHLREDQDSLREECDDTLQYLNQVIEGVRRLARDLSPAILRDLGLVTALRRLIHQSARVGGIRISSKIAPIDGLLSMDAEVACFRFFQEALNNIGKHARARHVSVAVKRLLDSVCCIVKDDGRGFHAERVIAADSAAGGMGLAIMKERALMLGGSLDIQSRPGKGTRIRFMLPIENAGNR